MGVIFDMDGTLIEPAIDFGALRAALQIPSGDLLHTIRGLDEARQQQAMQIIEDFEQAAASKMTLRPGALALLTHLDARGVPYAIVTRNAYPRVAQCLELLPGRRFWPILDREFWPPKPDPASLHHILEAWDIAPAQAWMVGDSSHDLDAAKAAKMRCALIRHDDNLHLEARADVTVDSLAQLISLW